MSAISEMFASRRLRRRVVVNNIIELGNWWILAIRQPALAGMFRVQICLSDTIVDMIVDTIVDARIGASFY